MSVNSRKVDLEEAYVVNQGPGHPGKRCSAGIHRGKMNEARRIDWTIPGVSLVEKQGV